MEEKPPEPLVSSKAFPLLLEMLGLNLAVMGAKARVSLHPGAASVQTVSIHVAILGNVPSIP